MTPPAFCLRFIQSSSPLSLKTVVATRFLRTQRPFPPCAAIRRITTKSSGTHVQSINSGNTYTQPSENLSQTVTSAEKRAYDKTLEENVEKQARAPWLRDRADTPPAEKLGSVRSFAKGKLLTTPSRMLKLIIPLANRDEIEDARKDQELEPLALLVHPQQPLSYLERLIQSELPTIKDDEGRDKIPNVSFRAPDAKQGEEEDGGEDGGEQKAKKAERESAKPKKDKEGHEEDSKDLEGSDVTIIDGKRVKTGVLKKKEEDADETPTNEPPKPPKEEEKDSPEADFVRWSGSTEIGDFIRDAARAHNFALDIEGYPAPIMVAVPSFFERTYYLRMRLRQKAVEIARLADIKRECDDTAHRGAKRVAYSIGGGLVGYWWIVYMCTFRTELGWDVMEPVTYLVGLTTLIGGYVWFLVHNRQVSYRSAMNFTISRRQQKLYDQKGFDVDKWEELVTEGNKLRREIKMIAEEYDVTWNEKEDAKSKKVIEALDKEKEKQKEKKKAKEEDDD